MINNSWSCTVGILEKERNEYFPKRNRELGVSGEGFRRNEFGNCANRAFFFGISFRNGGCLCEKGGCQFDGEATSLPKP